MSDKIENCTSVISIQGEEIDVNSITIQQLMLLLSNERVEDSRIGSERELRELIERQKVVAELHKVLSGINSETTKEGTLQVKEGTTLHALLKKAEELGVSLQKTEGSFERDERERLVQNLRLTIEDLNTRNEMQLQKVTKFTNERYEAYQMARSILKGPDEANKSSARKIAG